jgi:hypothetical protein
MDTVSADTLVQLVRANMWIPLLSVFVGMIIRLTKTDPAVAWFKLNTKPQHRPLWALGLAVVGAAVDRLATGGTWYDAIAGGVVAGCGAVAGHEVIVNTIRKGRDFGVRKEPPAPPPDWEDDSIRPPPGPKTVYPGPDPKVFPMTALAVAAWAFAWAFVLVPIPLTGCAGAGKVVCPVIDLASNLCPLILVKMADGSQELVPRDRLGDAAMRVRLSRIHAEAEMEREKQEIDKRLDEEMRRMRLDGGAE